MAEIGFEQVTCKYDGQERPAVDNLQLDVHDGEFMVLVGPVGLREVDALRMLAGLEDVTTGRVTIGGRDVTTCRPRTATSRWSSRTTRCTRT
jgi:multiple sugar transport system ATP-binding protein